MHVRPGTKATSYFMCTGAGASLKHGHVVHFLYLFTMQLYGLVGGLARLCTPDARQQRVELVIGYHVDAAAWKVHSKQKTWNYNLYIHAFLDLSSKF